MFSSHISVLKHIFMSAESAKTTLYIASSLDGFIADADGSVKWLETFKDTYDKGISGESYGDFFKTIDCLIMGARTYEQILTFGAWPYGNVSAFVITNRKLPATKNSIEFYSGDLNKLVEGVIKPKYKKSGFWEELFSLKNFFT